ncbi:MAG: acyltransferase, partial [Ilumatobacteraceae bacterium]
MRARRREHRPAARALPVTHPAVRWASRHSTGGTAAPRRRPQPSDPIRRSLGRHLDTGFRPDIEGLRALAVAAVVVFHARLFGLHGGFIGVDVFFVVSGYLITRLLVGELAATGRLALAAFWARRARRLLPASALVVVVTASASHLLLPPLTQRSVAVDVAGAATFTSSLVFADRLGSYFGAQLGQSTPSPLLHFWSLAVEEQFYLCWPLLLALLVGRPRQYRRLLLVTIGVLGFVGVALAAFLTPRAPSWAFFLLPTRMGELFAGALLAVLGTQVREIPPVVRAAMAWAGLAVIVVACWTFDEAMPWPGTAVLVPVVATMAVIVGGSATRVPWSATRALRVRGLQWLGRHSYALYLWHWPLLVLADARWGPLSWFQRVVAVAAAVGLSAASLRLVEDPVRHARWLAAVPARSLALGALLILAMLTSGWALARSIPALQSDEVAATPELVAVPIPSVTAAVVAPASPASTAPVVDPATATTTPASVAGVVAEGPTVSSAPAAPGPGATAAGAIARASRAPPTTPAIPAAKGWPTTPP